MSAEGSGSGVECFWGNLKDHPQCPHGPTLLFGKRLNGEITQYYACSACRDRKLCNFYLEKTDKLTKIQKNAWQAESKKFIQQYNHRKYFLRLNEITSERPENRGYCHTCGRLYFVNEIAKHKDHELTTGVTDDQLKNPTKILKPLSNPKKEAQYLFSEKATAEVVDLLIKAGAKHILCIGAPRIHEYITQNHEKMTSLLLDFDGRYHNFFGPLSFCWYNLFNNHFFTEESQEVFNDFLTQDNGKNIFLVCDPPFGGRVEFMSQTIKSITDSHRILNKLDNNETLKIFFVLPYFMESIMLNKSNPRGVDGGLKDLKMSDYKVDYENHPLFVTGSSGRKYGSPVRIFTNVSLNLLKLPEDGYKWCKRCDKWVARENKHCKLCKSCTSKDGRRYRHCKICNRCVKPTWKHCDKCERCVLEKHVCGIKPKITGECFTCCGTDHIAKDCPRDQSPIKRKKEDLSVKKNKKMKIEAVAPDVTSKKQKKIKLKNSKEKSTNGDLRNDIAKDCPVLRSPKKRKNEEDLSLKKKKKVKIEAVAPEVPSKKQKKIKSQTSKEKSANGDLRGKKLKKRQLKNKN
ncbi:rRNA N6-adenosine-methyltransferase ZCCHC4 [Diachasma alloeum]|uniref:rRNA N6-adenosine-methyltransferase ZCCHC4 n=1 Tax=Diachasma alloeum TaxID=454923 RepID=UPI0007382EB8|nr:rRNA N6-adenosine-methyltransferase ZCCHC4 [Diachasma alloeum]